MATATNAPTAMVVCRVVLPEPVFDKYYKLAEKTQFDPTEIMAQRLETAVDRNDQKPLYFTDEQRRELEKLVSQNLGGPQAALGAIRRAVEMSVSGVRVQISPQITERLSTRVPEGMRWEDYIAGLVRAYLEEYVGLG